MTSLAPDINVIIKLSALYVRHDASSNDGTFPIKTKQTVREIKAFYHKIYSCFDCFVQNLLVFPGFRVAFASYNHLVFVCFFYLFLSLSHECFKTIYGLFAVMF